MKRPPKPRSQNQNRKTLQISHVLHAVIQRRAEREGRLIVGELAMALRPFLADEFPRDCPEYDLLPENLR